MPTPEHQSFLPTPITQRRKPHGDKLAVPGQGVGLPTPETLPRKRASTILEDDEGDDTLSPPSPTGHTTFVLSHVAAGGVEKVPARRRPGLLFAQQMGLMAGPSTSTVSFGGRLGVGVGMGGGLRTSHVDKMLVDPLENPFVDSTRKEPPPPPGSDTSYVPQLLRPSAERSLSPHPKARPRTQPGSPESSLSKRRARMLVDDDNPFISKPGEVVRPHPTSEDQPLVTYVFRGAKKVFANPFIHPSSQHAGSELDPSDPDYDAHPCPPPRLLWPTEAGPSKMEVDGDDFVEVSDQDDDIPVHRGLLFGSSAKRSRSPEASNPKRRRLSQADF